MLSTNPLTSPRSNSFRFLKNVIPKEAIGALFLILGANSSLYSDSSLLTKIVGEVVTSELYYLLFCLFLASSTLPLIFNVKNELVVSISNIVSRVTQSSLVVGFALLTFLVVSTNSILVQPLTIAYTAILAVVPTWVVHLISCLRQDDWTDKEEIALHTLCYQSLLTLPVLLHELQI